jgi:H3 lysine-79-specific histone-lysine N-methyltransferase
MLSSPSRSSTDLDFFSPSKLPQSGASTTSTVVVTTRYARRPVALPHRTSSASPPSSSPYSSLSSSPATSPSIAPKKRKSLPAGLSPGGSELPRDVKRLRTASTNQKPTKRKTKSSCQSSSRASSRPRTLPSSPEPIYRSSRSRSTSTFNLQETGTAARKRRWCTDEDGAPGPNHLSSEMVVKKLMKSYKACEFPHLFSCYSWNLFFLSCRFQESQRRRRHVI